MIKRNIKIVVTPDESKQVQEICFANGIGWKIGIFEVQHLHSKYLFINKAYLTSSMIIQYCDTEELFKVKRNEEVDATLFIRTNGTCVEETLEQELKQNINKEETMEKNEVESYADVKEYLIANGLYERVLGIDWGYVEVKPKRFIDLFSWDNVEEGFDFWDNLDDELRALDICDRIESLVQDYKAKQGKEFIKHLEAQPKEVVETKPAPTSYNNVKEYLIAKGLYEDVLSFDIDFNGYSPYFGNMFWFAKTPQGYKFWNKINSELVKLEINDKINEILEDYEVRNLEVVEAKPLEKPKQYLCFVQGKALPKHIHKTLEQAKQEAQRLCRKELTKVSVLEVVAEFEAEVLVKEVL